VLGAISIQEREAPNHGGFGVKAIGRHLGQGDHATSPVQQERRVSNKVKAFLALQTEHKNILNQTHDLIEEVRKIAQSNDKSFTSRKNVAQQFAALKRLLVNHQRNEEHVILPIMLEYFDTEASDVIDDEHAELSMALNRLSRKISELKHLHSHQAVEALAEAADEFDSLVRANFSREENVIHWFASCCISIQESTRKENCSLMGPNDCCRQGGLCVGKE